MKKMMYVALVSLGFFSSLNCDATTELIKQIVDNTLTEESLISLLQDQADINYVFATRNMLRYSIEAAIKFNSTDTLQLLLQYGLDPSLEVVNNLGNLPCRIGNGYKYKTDMNPQEKFQSQHMALEIFTVLLAAGTDIAKNTNDPCYYEKSLLHNFLERLVDTFDELSKNLLQEAIHRLLIASRQSGISLFSEPYIAYELQFIDREHAVVRMEGAPGFLREVSYIVPREKFFEVTAQLFDSKAYLIDR